MSYYFQQMIERLVEKDDEQEKRRKKRTVKISLELTQEELEVLNCISTYLVADHTTTLRYLILEPGSEMVRLLEEKGK